MAVIEVKGLSSLKIKLSLGTVDGKAKTKIKSFSYLKNSATTQDAYDVATALMSLQEYSVLDIVKQDNTSLNE